jgi:SAM-dependent methyltransferase
MSENSTAPAIDIFERSLPDKSFVADIGSGDGGASRYLKNKGHNVVEIDYGRDGIRFEDLKVENYFDGLHCSHMLEHCKNPGIVLDKFRDIVTPGGYICLIVPPAKHNVVGGHLTLWNAGILLYNLVRAHVDCRDARIRSYGYNVAVVCRNYWAEYDDDSLFEDNGDIEKLAEFFPFPVSQGFDGRIASHNWRPFPKV